MSTNSEEIVQQIRCEVEALLTFVVGTPSTPFLHAYDMERSLLQRLRELGKMLLHLYFCVISQQFCAETTRTADGQCLPYHSQRERSYLSVFGKLRFRRAYYYQPACQSGYFPADAALNLPAKGGSDLLRQWREQLGTSGAYHDVGPTLTSLVGPLPFSTRALQQEIVEDAALVESFYAQLPPPIAVAEASILVLQADGKGVPMRQPTAIASPVRLGKGQKNGRKKEAIVTSVYTLVPWVRTPQEVTASFFKLATKPPEEPMPTRRGPSNKRLWASLEGKEATLKFTARHLIEQEGEHIANRVALTDGSEALQQRVREQFADFVLILDFIHANAYLWEAANALLGENSPLRQDWVITHTLRMLCGETPELVAQLRRMAAEPGCKPSLQATLLKVADYYQRNQDYMHYDRYLAAGWPIATGVVEGACRHVVKDRCELSGMRWSQAGAEALLRMRCVAENGDWEDFHAFRRKSRQSALNRGETKSNTPLEQMACLVNQEQNTWLAA